jgi:WD40 repeat protein
VPPLALAAPTATPPLPEQIITPDNLPVLRLLRTIGYGEIVDAAIAPAGKLLAVATSAGVALFELPSLRHLRFIPLAGRVDQVALSPDGQRMLVGTELRRVADDKGLGYVDGELPRFSRDGGILATLQWDSRLYAIDDLARTTTRLWRADDGAPLLTLRGYAAAFSPDGQLLALSTGRAVRLVRLPGGQEVRTLTIATPDYVKDLAFSADGQVLQVALVQEIQAWQVADGRLINTQAIDDTGNSHVALGDVGLSPVGDLLASTPQAPEGPNGSVRLRHTSDLSSFAGPGGDPTGGHNKIRFSADGTAAVLWTDSFSPADSLRVLDLQAGATADLSLPTFAGLTFSPDAQTLAAFSSTQATLWRVTDSTLQQTLDTGLHAFGGGRLRFAPDGRTLALGGDELIMYGDYAGQLVVWDLAAGGARLVSWNQYLASIPAFSASGAFLEIDPLGTYLVRPTRGISVSLSLSSVVTAAAFSPDGALLAVGDRSGSAHLFTIDGKRTGTLKAGGEVNGMFFSPDGSLLAARREDGLVQIWRIGTPTPFAQLATAADDALIFTADNQMLISGGRGGVTFYRVSDGMLLHKLNVPAEDIAIGPRRRLLAILHNGQIQLWGMAP